MRIRSPLSAVLAPRGSRPALIAKSRRPAGSSDTAPWTPDSLPHGVVDVASETANVLAACGGFAQRRSVRLQTAIEPCLVAQASAAEYRACLRDLILDAIGRADSGVLVTGTRQADGAEIAILDDGTAPPGAAHPVQRYEVLSVPTGSTMTVDYQAEHGTTILLHLPQPGGLTEPSDADMVAPAPASAHT
jgi:hypothetical protein